VTRRSYTPSVPQAPDLHGQRRATGGARREASERIIIRGAGFETTGWTLNVSRGGVRVIVEDEVELGREYDFYMGDEQGSLKRRGRVVWLQDEADGQVAGVQYLDVDGSVPPGPDADHGSPGDAPKKP
jgi:hypothetical protein